MPDLPATSGPSPEFDLGFSVPEMELIPPELDALASGVGSLDTILRSAASGEAASIRNSVGSLQREIMGAAFQEAADINAVADRMTDTLFKGAIDEFVDIGSAIGKVGSLLSPNDPAAPLGTGLPPAPREIGPIPRPVNASAAPVGGSGDLLPPATEPQPFIPAEGERGGASPDIAPAQPVGAGDLGVVKWWVYAVDCRDFSVSAIPVGENYPGTDVTYPLYYAGLGHKILDAPFRASFAEAATLRKEKQDQLAVASPEEKSRICSSTAPPVDYSPLEYLPSLPDFTAPLLPPLPEPKCPGGQVESPDTGECVDPKIEKPKLLFLDFWVWPDWSKLDACREIDLLRKKVVDSDNPVIGTWIGLYDEKMEPAVPDWCRSLTDAILWTPQQWLNMLRDFLKVLAKASAISSGQAANVSLSVTSAISDLFAKVSGLATETEIKLKTVSDATRAAMPLIIAAGAREILKIFEGLIRQSFGSRKCNWAAAVVPCLANLLLGVLEKYISADFGDMKIGVEYYFNTLCPTLIPSTAESGMAYLAGELTYEQWACWVRANNSHEDPAFAIVKASRSRPNDNEVIQLYMRGEIPYDVCLMRLRDLGYLDQEEAEEKIRLAEQLPGPTDLVSFMQRDVFDKLIVEEYNYDDEFGDKFQGKAKDLATAVGVSEETMRMYWRAHWQLPSPTQAYEMLHRLRPGRVDKELEVTEETVFKLLGTADYAPGWRKRLMAVSYVPLTRVDISRAYAIGAMSREEVVESYKDRGYSAADAETLTKFQDKLQAKAIAARTATLTPRKILKGIEKGTIGEVESYNLLLQAGVKGDEIERAVKSAVASRGLLLREKAIKSIRSRFRYGEIDGPALGAELIAAGLDSDTALSLREEWMIEQSSRSKHAEASRLCEWVKKGLITFGDMLIRLVRLGWSRDDAEKIVAGCGTDIQLGIDKDMAKAKEKLDKEAKRAAAEREKLAKKFKYPSKHPGVKDILKFLDAGQIDEAEATQRIIALGYLETDAAKYLNSRKKSSGTSPKGGT